MDYLEDNLLSRYKYSEDQLRELKIKISIRKNKESWLQGTIELPIPTAKPGRPTKSFENLSERSKRRKTQIIRENLDSEKLIYATQMKRRLKRVSGKAAASKTVKEITEMPRRVPKYKLANLKSLQDKREKLSTFKSLSMFVEAGLSRR